MIIFGFGNDNQVLADAGMMKCKNCRNFSFFSLHETARKFTLYFVKVARYEKKCFLVCETCTAGYEVNEAMKNDILRHSVSLPSRQTFGVLWRELEQGLNASVARGGDIASSFASFKEGLYRSYPAQQVELVAQTLVRCLTDKDPPR